MVFLRMDRPVGSVGTHQGEQAWDGPKHSFCFSHDPCRFNRFLQKRR